MDYASSRDAMDLYSFDFPPMEERAGRRLSEVFGSSRDLYEISKEVGGVQGSIKGEWNGRREDWI